VNIVEANALGKRYRTDWALQECSLAVPSERVVALVGPNGAGKTTLLHLAVGLATPTTGTIRVLGELEPGSPEALAQIAFVAQDAPLHRHLSVQAMLEVTDALNPGLDVAQTKARLRALHIPLDRKVGKLSGGQQSQLALTLALARHPSLLVLDEPLARLDPLARHDFMAQVMASAMEESISVLFSSHVVSELERVADYLIVLGHGHVQLAGDIEEVLADHAVLSGSAEELDRIHAQCTVVHAEVAGRQAQLVVRLGDMGVAPSGWERATISLEELVLAYLREPEAMALPLPLRISASRAEVRS